MLDAAIRIVNTKCGDFNPEVFQGEYEDALKELIEKKATGERIERPKEPARAQGYGRRCSPIGPARKGPSLQQSHQGDRLRC